MTPTRPAIRYYGGKWKIAPWIIGHFPKHKTYVEPFGGAGSVLLRKKPSTVEVWNDLNDEVVNLFQVLRNPEQAADLRRLLALTPYSRTELELCYAFCEDPVEQARRTVVVFGMSHNPSKVMRRQSSSFRSSSAGYHRLPQDFQRSAIALEAITERLLGVVIEKRDYRSIMMQHDHPTTLHYVDPPYLQVLRSRQRNHYAHEMLTMEQHQELCQFLLTMKGFVILSGYDCIEYDQWLPGWGRVTTTATTGAATTGGSTATEVLWMNPRTMSQLRAPKLF